MKVYLLVAFAESQDMFVLDVYSTRELAIEAKDYLKDYPHSLYIFPYKIRKKVYRYDLRNVEDRYEI